AAMDGRKEAMARSSSLGTGGRAIAARSLALCPGAVEWTRARTGGYGRALTGRDVIMAATIGTARGCVVSGLPLVVLAPHAAVDARGWRCLGALPAGGERAHELGGGGGPSSAKVPSCTMRPASSTAIRSASAVASPMSWAT